MILERQKKTDKELHRERQTQKGLKREKAKWVWESFEAEVHCGRADSVSGGSEVWNNASDWRRAAAVEREQNIRCEKKRRKKGLKEHRNLEEKGFFV